MKISQVFPSKYITAADLQGRTITLTITNVTMEEMITHDSQKANKPVAWFERTNKGFVMNLTNAKIVANLYGDETDGWTGKRISLYPTRVKAFGAMTDCIRVREEIPAQPKPPAQAAQVEDTNGLDDDEDVTDYEEGDEPPQAEGDFGMAGADAEHTRRMTQKGAEPSSGNGKHESPPHQRLWGVGLAVFGPDDWDSARGWLISKWTAKMTPDNTRSSSSELSDDEKTELGDYMNEHAATLQKVWKGYKAAQMQSTGQEDKVVA